MKRLTLLVTLLSFCFCAFAQTQSEVIQNANDLIANKKYESAFSLLEDFDQKNEMPDIVLLKEKIALEYYVTSIMHQMFTFRDIDINDDILKYRGVDEGTQNLHMFLIPDILDSLILKYPDNCMLRKGLGDYVYDFQRRYSSMIEMSQDSLDNLIKDNYLLAIKGNCADHKTYYELGYLILSENSFTESIPYFKKAIELDTTDASANYNLGYAYMSLGQNDSALFFAGRSLILYDDSIYKGDAARMIGSLYFSTDEKKSMKYYEMSDSINPGNYYTLNTLLYLYLKNNDPLTKETRELFFEIAPEHTAIYNALADIYYSLNKTDDLIKFYKTKINDYRDNDAALGNIYFYLAGMYMDSDKKNAKKYLLKAKETFTKIYPYDNPVFEIIEQGLLKADEK
jgi:tetratricopeptide (TPR) repeat protein